MRQRVAGFFGERLSDTRAQLPLWLNVVAVLGAVNWVGLNIIAAIGMTPALNVGGWVLLSWWIIFGGIAVGARALAKRFARRDDVS